MAHYLEAGSSASVWNTETSLVGTFTAGPVGEKLVAASNAERRRIESMIHETLPRAQIIDVKKVQNSFLEAKYLMKKDEYMSRNRRVEEKNLIHVTGMSNVNSIIENNFDWRRVSRGKFGLGTSFSNDAKYADQYANYDIGNSRAFIITKVLVSNEILGKEGLKIPKYNYDTTTGNGNKVYVKFCDNETLPSFVAYYISSCPTRRRHNYSFFNVDSDNDFDFDDYLSYDYDSD